MKELNIGDKIYCLSSFANNEIKNIYQVEKVTKSQAILNNGDKFKRLINEFWGLERIPKETGLRHYYHELETPELKNKYEIQKAFEKAYLLIKDLENTIIKTKDINLLSLENISKNIVNIKDQFINDIKNKTS